MTVIIGQHISVAGRLAQAFMEATEKNYIAAVNRAFSQMGVQVPEKVQEIKNIFIDHAVFLLVTLAANTVGSINENLENAIITSVRQKFANLRQNVLAQTQMQEKEPH